MQVVTCRYKVPTKERQNPSLRIKHFVSSTSPDLRARRGIRGLLAAIGIDHNAGIALGRISRDVRKVVTARGAFTAAANYELSAFSIELRSVGLVKSKQLVSNEIVARGQRARDGGLPVEVLQDIVCTPGSPGQRGCRHSLLVNLGHVSVESNLHSNI